MHITEVAGSKCWGESDRNANFHFWFCKTVEFFYFLSIDWQTSSISRKILLRTLPDLATTLLYGKACCQTSNLFPARKTKIDSDLNLFSDKVDVWLIWHKGERVLQYPGTTLVSSFMHQCKMKMLLSYCYTLHNFHFNLFWSMQECSRVTFHSTKLLNSGIWFALITRHLRYICLILSHGPPVWYLCSIQSTPLILFKFWNNHGFRLVSLNNFLIYQDIDCDFGNTV